MAAPLERTSAAHHAAAHAATTATTAAEAAETAHAAVAATKGAEAPGEGQDDIASDGEGTGLGVGVRVLSRAQVITLAQEVITVQGDGL